MESVNVNVALLSVTAVLLSLFFFWLGYQWNRNTGRAIKRQRIENKTSKNVYEENVTLTRLNKTDQKTIKSLQKDNEWYKKERKRFNDIRREDKDKLWSLQTKAKRDEEALRSMIQNLRCKNTDLKNSCNILRHCIVKLQKGMGNEQNHMKSLKRQLHTVCKSTAGVTKSKLTVPIRSSSHDTLTELSQPTVSEPLLVVTSPVSFGYTIELTELVVR